MKYFLFAIQMIIHFLFVSSLSLMVVFITLSTVDTHPPKQSQLVSPSPDSLHVFMQAVQLSLQMKNTEQKITAIHRALLLETKIGAIDWPFPDISREELVASLFGGLAEANRNRRKGNRSDNLEQAITHYKVAIDKLKGRLCQKNSTCIYLNNASDPNQIWAQLNYKLANIYKTRKKGKRDQNLKAAILHYKNTFTVYSKYQNPQKWAEMQETLGDINNNQVLLQREGIYQKGKSQIDAVKHYKNALTVMTNKNTPIPWARIHYNLAIVYANYRGGLKTDNQELSISYYNQALTVYTKNRFPKEWADIQINLAGLFLNRIQDSPGKNVDYSIKHLENALGVYTKQTFPTRWAEIQDGLGNAYFKRKKGNFSDNIELAITHHLSALDVVDKKTKPITWAATQNSLANAYWLRKKGLRVKNENASIAHYQQALNIYTKDRFPKEWADTKYNLGNIYKNLITGKRDENLTTAVTYYKQALEVYHPVKSPAFVLLIPDRYSSSTLSWANDQFPQEKLRTAHALGQLYIEQKKYRSALLAFSRSKEAFDILFRRGLDLTETQDVIEIANTMFEDAAFAAASVNKLSMALNWLEQGKARLLGVSLKLDTLVFSMTASEGQRYKKLQLDITREQSNIRTAQSHSTKLAALDHLKSARQELLRLINRVDSRAKEGNIHLWGWYLDRERDLKADYRNASSVLKKKKIKKRISSLDKRSSLFFAHKKNICKKYPQQLPIFLTSQERQELGLVCQKIALAQLENKTLSRVEKKTKTILELANQALFNEGTIAVPLLTSYGAKVLLIRKTKNKISLSQYALPINAKRQVDTLINNWQATYQAYLKGEQAASSWHRKINDIGTSLWPLLGRPLLQALNKEDVKKNAPLVILPTGALGLLPLGLIKKTTTGLTLDEQYDLSFAPSLEALSKSRIRVSANAANPDSLLAIVNPTGDLSGTEEEAALISPYFKPAARMQLQGSPATASAVLKEMAGKKYWHFASHGTFDWSNARNSGLVMSDGNILTIDMLLKTKNLGTPRLAVLSACETGIYDLKRNANEFIGLPSAFLQVGAAGVVASLWAVDDRATSLLMARFYELHMAQGLSPVQALRKAKAWLRSSTNVKLLAYVKDAVKRGRLEPALLANLRKSFTRKGLRTWKYLPLVRWVNTRSSEERSKIPADLQRGFSISNADKNNRKNKWLPYANPYFWGGFSVSGY